MRSTSLGEIKKEMPNKKPALRAGLLFGSLTPFEPTTGVFKPQFAVKKHETIKGRLLRCPEFLCLMAEIPTAATSSPRFSRRRRRFGSSPTDFA